jgi:hypothetical protein
MLSEDSSCLNGWPQFPLAEGTKHDDPVVRNYQEHKNTVLDTPNLP